MTTESKLVPVALLRNIEMTWREASAFSNTANQLIETGLPELRALLAAPVVERQPVAWLGGGKPFLIEVDAREYAGYQRRNSVEALYTAPPELAELQATIARLTAENERLKGGQGEPIYQVQYRGDGGGGWSDAEKASYDMKVPHPKHWMTRIVYEQPAPVADPEIAQNAARYQFIRSEAGNYIGLSTNGEEMDAAIDAELNKIKDKNQ